LKVQHAGGVRRDDPSVEEFRANAVLTMHRVEAALEPAEVFTMLCEQQLQSVPGTHEQHRDLAAAAEGPGAAGSLSMRINSDLGPIDSVSRSRIITTGQEVLIAQLTATALHDSPADGAPTWITVQRVTLARTVAADHLSGPVARMQGRR